MQVKKQKTAPRLEESIKKRRNGVFEETKKQTSKSFSPVPESTTTAAEFDDIKRVKAEHLHSYHAAASKCRLWHRFKQCYRKNRLSQSLRLDSRFFVVFVSIYIDGNQSPPVSR